MSKAPDTASAPAAPLEARSLETDPYWAQIGLAVSDPEAFAALAGPGRALLSSSALVLSGRDARAVAGIVSALSRALALPAVKKAVMVLAGSPDLPEMEPSPGILGLDFHLGPDGPKLIEINTNPGGLLVVAAAARAAQALRPDLGGLETGALPLSAIEEAIFSAFIGEWRRVRASGLPAGLAIVDEAVATQALYPEFLLYRALFQARGVRAEIVDAAALEAPGGALVPYDLIYNRVTDFFLERPEHQGLAALWREGRALLIPDPLAHTLWSDKRFLALLCDRAGLEALGVPPVTAEVLSSATPSTVLGSTGNWDALWSQRKRWFFKPVRGHAGKAVYRGEKISRTTWGTLTPDRYIAQAFVPPPRVELADGVALKADLRAFVWGETILLFAARLYEGQATNFRTPNGGFAPVFIRN